MAEVDLSERKLTTLRVVAVYPAPTLPPTTVGVVCYHDPLNREAEVATISKVLHGKAVNIGRFKSQLPSIPESGLIRTAELVPSSLKRKRSLLAPNVPADRHIILPDEITTGSVFRVLLQPFMDLLFPDHTEFAMGPIGITIKYKVLPEQPWPLTLAGFPLLIVKQSRMPLDRKAMMPVFETTSANSGIKLLDEPFGTFTRARFDFVLSSVSFHWKQHAPVQLGNLAWVLVSPRTEQMFIVLKDKGNVGEAWNFMPEKVARLAVSYINEAELCLPQDKVDARFKRIDSPSSRPASTSSFTSPNDDNGASAYVTPPTTPPRMGHNLPLHELFPPMVFLKNKDIQGEMDGQPIFAAARFKEQGVFNWTLYSWDHFSSNAKEFFDEEQMRGLPVRTTEEGRLHGHFQYQIKKGPAAGLVVSLAARDDLAGKFGNSNIGVN